MLPDVNKRLLKSAALAVSVSLCSAPLNAAEFLYPLPVQELNLGELYTLGIRPSKAPARSALNTKLSLYIEGLSASASFRRTGDELWELAWSPVEADKGVHVIRILVTERDTPGQVIEVEEMTFIIGGALAKPVLDAAPTPTPTTPDLIAVAPLVSTDLSEATIVVEAVSEGGERVLAADWSLAPISSQIVTPHQWVRFPVQLLSDSDSINDQVALQVDQLPNGASFEPSATGGRQFEWRPESGDTGEHVFQFTAIDTENDQRRESITMRIIVQE